MTNNIFYVAPEMEDMRLDKFLAEIYPEKSRTFLQNLSKDGYVTVNGKIEKVSYKVKEDDSISLVLPDAEDVKILPENIPLDIIYEDDDVLIVNKPKNMVVHPAPGHLTGTLVNAVLFHCKDSLSGINGEIRPGIVHRIDMDTTGSLIVCKNDDAHNKIAAQIKEHSVRRIYIGVAIGNVKEEEGTIESTIGRHPIERKKMAMNVKNGKEAITHYRVLERLKGYTLCEFQLETGRTHQIRVHMAGIGHPLAGDPLYGSGKNPLHLNGQALHAKTIGFIHPKTNEYVEFEAPIPEYMEELIKKLR